MSGDIKVRHPHQASAIEKQTARTPKPKKRRSWRLLTMLASLAALIYLLPGIVVHSPLLGWVVNKAAADLNGSVSIQSVPWAGWFSPITITGVEVMDAEGKSVVSISAIWSEKSLWQMIRNHSDLGRFHVESPKLSLVLRDDGSNVEDLLAKYLGASKEAERPAAAEKPSAPIGFAVQVNNASATIADRASGREWQVHKLSLDLDMSGGASGPISAKLSAELPDAQHPGKLDGEAHIGGGAGEAAFDAANVPLTMFRALAARFAPGTTLTGRLSSSVIAKWGGSAADTNRLQADLNLESFSLAAPFLQTDTVALDLAHGVCEASWTADRLEIEKTTLDCDVGSLFLKGTVPFGKAGSVTVDSIIHQRQELNGRLDLARLARLLPATLHLRQGMRIDSGQMQLSAVSRPEAQGMIWQGQLQAADLAGGLGERRIAWQQPILAILQAREGPQGPVIDSLRCESDFLKFHGAGTMDRLTASFSFSLGRLAEQLGQFVDLAGLHLSGEGTGSLNWTRTPQQQFTAGAEMQINGFQLATAGKRAWIEPSLSATFSANGQTDLGEKTRIDNAALTLKTAGDQISARLTGTVADLAGGGTWPVRLDMQGQLQNWPPRLAPWASMDDWRVGGTYSLEAEATASKNAAQLRLFKLSTGPLTVASKSFNANEPVLEVSAAGSWDGQQRRVQIDQAGLSCATVAVGVSNAFVSMPESAPMQMVGAISYNAYLGSLKKWFADPAEKPDWKLSGQLKGTAQLRQEAGITRGAVDAEILNLAVIDAKGQQFQEPIVKLTAAGDYDGKEKVLQLGKFELTSSALAAGAAGRSGPVGDHSEAQIDGSLRYDVERIAGLMGPYLGPGVKIVGRGETPFQYRGPLTLAAGSASAGIKWDWANIYGFQIGPGKLKAAMGDGAVRIEPLDLAVSRGRMRVAPKVRLSPEPMELTLPAGPLLENIQIDPAMCSNLLMYIAPVLAEVTSAEGSFSIVLNSCRVPLADPKKTDLAGRFLVHSVVIGPGPLVRELAVLLGRESPAKLRRESSVSFQMRNGRVHHQNLELIFPDLTIRTQGSVGLDQTMELTAEMPVPPKWLAKNPLASKALANQVIRIPLKGTLKKPQLDKREMERLSAQFIRKAAGNLLENELNKLPESLDRLLKPRK